MVLWRDILALGGAVAVTAAMGAVFILPAVYPQAERLGYLSGTVGHYEVTVTKYGGTRGTFEVRLDQGAVVRVAAQESLVPGARVCVRAVQRGARVEGHLVAMERCPAR